LRAAPSGVRRARYIAVAMEADATRRAPCGRPQPFAFGDDLRAGDAAIVDANAHPRARPANADGSTTGNAGIVDADAILAAAIARVQAHLGLGTADAERRAAEETRRALAVGRASRHAAAVGARFSGAALRAIGAELGDGRASAVDAAFIGKALAIGTATFGGAAYAGRSTRRDGALVLVDAGDHRAVATVAQAVGGARFVGRAVVGVTAEDRWTGVARRRRIGRPFERRIARPSFLEGVLAGRIGPRVTRSAVTRRSSVRRGQHTNAARSASVTERTVRSEDALDGQDVVGIDRTARNKSRGKKEPKRAQGSFHGATSTKKSRETPRGRRIPRGHSPCTLLNPSRGGLAASLRGYSPKWPIEILYGEDLPQ